MSGNRLQHSTSPYLQQHADNPVNWYPWDEEALQKAKMEDKPILLSIGYSACHWCHVMAHESFEDPATAELMNQQFVNIKVDREERPDLDKVYQSAHQLLTQRPGGWPLTMILTPEDLTPFFAGTYFPREPRAGMPSFSEVLTSIVQAYRQQRDDINSQNQALTRAIRQIDPIPAGRRRPLDPGPLEAARQQLAQSFDADHGGFGQAPKFPHPSSLEQLLRHWAATGFADPRSLYMVDTTLQRMALGGIYDQLGGGFFRYSVDGQWMIPHFEKMLYDNGPLLAAYADLFQVTGNPLYQRVAEETAGWLAREMTAEGGGFFASLDADSESGEGGYYAWSKEELQDILDGEELAHIGPFYGLDQAANFEARWHLHNRLDLEQLCQQTGSSPEHASDLIDRARGKLLAARNQRQRPGRDEKLLTTWNALMVKGLARSARLLNRPEHARMAIRATDFLSSQLWDGETLHSSFKDGVAYGNGYLDDYANLIDALLELLQVDWSSTRLQLATTLADQLMARFEDPQLGGFYFTAHDHESLIYRPKTFGDDSLPAGNAIAAHALTRLGYLLGRSDYLEAAERSLLCTWEQLERIPHAHCALLKALDEQLYPTEMIILRGTDDELRRWQARANTHYAPRRMTLAIPNDATELPRALQGKAAGEQTRAYFCSGSQCEAPISGFDAFEQRLASSEAPDQAVDTSFHGALGSFKRLRD